MENNNEFLAMKQRAKDSNRYETIEQSIKRLEGKIDQLMAMLEPKAPAKKATK